MFNPFSQDNLPKMSWEDAIGRVVQAWNEREDNPRLLAQTARQISEAFGYEDPAQLRGLFSVAQHLYDEQGTFYQSAYDQLSAKKGREFTENLYKTSVLDFKGRFEEAIRGSASTAATEATSQRGIGADELSSVENETSIQAERITRSGVPYSVNRETRMPEAWRQFTRASQDGTQAWRLDFDDNNPTKLKWVEISPDSGEGWSARQQSGRDFEKAVQLGQAMAADREQIARERAQIGALDPSVWNAQFDAMVRTQATPEGHWMLLGQRTQFDDGGINRDITTWLGNYNSKLNSILPVDVKDETFYKWGEAIRAAYARNYSKVGLKQGTGQLYKSIKDATIRVVSNRLGSTTNGSDSRGFVVEIELLKLPRDPRWNEPEQPDRQNTWYYGPRVFASRGPIRPTEQNFLQFELNGRRISTRYVRSNRPMNPMDLDDGDAADLGRKAVELIVEALNRQGVATQPGAMPTAYTSQG